MSLIRARRIGPTRQLGRSDGERGTTAVELSVTVALLGIVAATALAATISMTNVIAINDRRATNIDEARTLMAVTSRDLRTATRLVAGTPAFTVAAEREVTFYANLDNPNGGPKLVRIYVDTNTQLIESITPPDAGSVAPNYTYNNGPAKIRYVGRYVANPVGTPIFQFYDSNGVALPGGALSAADRLAVNQVKITMSIRKSTTYTVGATTLVNRVRLPNLNYQVLMGG
ncbi:MAG: hypothetical protein U0V73_08515 [Acidimicrobiia bacterium]